MNGIVRRYDNNKGFGFIEVLIGRPGATRDVFFHISAMLRPEGQITVAPPPVGAEVKFTLVRRDEKGPQAANVELISVSGRALWADQQPDEVELLAAPKRRAS